MKKIAGILLLCFVLTGCGTLYVRLPRGNYRIGKEITDFRVAGDFDKRIFYAYFEIN